MTPEEEAAAEAAGAASQKAAEEEAAARAAEEAAKAAKTVYTAEELAALTPTDIDLDRVDPSYRPIVENTIRDYKNLQADHTKKAQTAKDLERESAYWKKVALEKEQAAQPPEAAPESPAITPRPRLDQYDTSAEYEDALLEWHDTRREVASRAAQQRAEEQVAFQTFQEKANAFRAEHEDFDEVIESPVFSEAMRATILRSENGPQLAYHLGRPENKVAAERILALPPERQAYEIGKLETQLVLAVKTRKPTGAPPPITPLGMSGGGAGEIDESKMSDDEWFALDKKRRLEKIRKKLGG